MFNPDKPMQTESNRTKPIDCAIVLTVSIYKSSSFSLSLAEQRVVKSSEEH